MFFLKIKDGLHKEKKKKKQILIIYRKIVNELQRWKQWQKNWNKTQDLKDKNFFPFCGLWLNKVENNQRENVLKYKIQKNRYMKIHNIFFITKVLLPNDEDPFANKVGTLELKWVRNIEMLRTRLKRSN